MPARTEATRFARGSALAALVFALAACCAPAANAFPKPRAGLEAMLTGSRSWYPEDPYASYSDPTYRFAGGYALGGTLGWALGGPFALETGLRYSLDSEQRETSAAGILGSAEFISRTRLHRAGLPVRLRLALPFVHGLSAEGTAETQYLLQARRDDEVHSSSGIFVRTQGGSRVARPGAIIFEEYTGQEDITGMFARWNLALGGGLGWEFPLGRTTGEVRARYQQGVSDQTLTPYAKDFSRVAEAGLAIRW